MKKILIAILLLIPVLSFGQNEWTVLLLKNGNKVEGTVLSSDDYKVTIQTPGGQVLTYNRTEINRIDASVPTDPKTVESPYKDFTIVKSGFWWGAALSVGVAIPYADYLHPVMPAEVNFSLGYRFNEFIKIGVGTGYRYYFLNNLKDSDYGRYKSNVVKEKDGSFKQQYFKNMCIPLFATASGNFIPNRSRNGVPYWEVDGGYAFGDGGFFSPEIGLRFGPLERHHFGVSIGYLLQGTNIVDPLPLYTIEGDIRSNYRRARADAQPDPYYMSTKRGLLHALRLKVSYEF